MAAARRIARGAPCRRGQRGETLLESLIAVTILTLVAIAAYAGLRTAMTVSVQHKESAVAETLLRTAAERLQDPTSPYVPRAGCPGAGAYADLPTEAGYGPIDVEVRFWTPPADVAVPSLHTQFAAVGTCPANDPGLQALALRVTTPSGRTEHLEIVKRAS